MAGADSFNSACLAAAASVCSKSLPVFHCICRQTIQQVPYGTLQFSALGLLLGRCVSALLRLGQSLEAPLFLRAERYAPGLPSKLSLNGLSTVILRKPKWAVGKIRLTTTSLPLPSNVTVRVSPSR